MKVLFLTHLYLEESNGITKKIESQVEALRQNGLEVHFCYFSLEQGIRFWSINDNHIDRIGTKKDIIFKTLAGTYYNKIISYIKQEKIDYLYIRYRLNGSPFFNRFLNKVHRNNTKILMEIPTYPYDGENSQTQFIKRLPVYLEKHARANFHKYIERIITFSDDKEIFGIPTIRISNAIDIKRITLRDKKPNNSHLNMTGVANLNFWHGYDRLIAGLSEYYKTPKEKEVYFNIVGNGLIKEELEELAHKKGVNKYVRFHGPKQNAELDKIFLDTDICIGCLACHRKNIKEVKSLKNVEYAARGIPFVYSENNNDFDKQPYVIKVPQDETPIDILNIIENFYRIRTSPEEIRESISNLTWEKQMKIIADYINNRI